MVSPRKAINLGKKAAPPGHHRLAVGGSDVANIARKGPRVVWYSNLTWVFFELAVMEIEEEGRSTTQLPNHSFGRIAKRLSALTNLPVTQVQCKNRYQVLRCDWQAWQLLTNARRGATGLGFDAARGTYTAPDFFWNNFIAQNEHVAKFQDQPLDHEELMQRVFQEVTTTGSYVYILAEHDTEQNRELDMENESFDVDTERLDEEEIAEGNGNTIGVDLRDDVGTQVPSQVNDGGTPSYPRSMSRNPGQGSSGSKRKTPSTGTYEISQSMNRILRNRDSQKPFKTLCRTKHTMFEVTQILDEMEEFNTAPCPDVYWWFMEYLKENLVDADIFMAKSSEHARVEFVYHLHKKATLFARGEHDAFAPPPPWVPRSRHSGV